MKRYELKIIHLFPTPNVYSVVNEQDQPDFTFTTANSKLVGIFRDHWCNLLSDAVMSISGDYEIEIWQPDHHAERIYEHTFENNVKHILFPFGVKLHNPEHSYNTADLKPFFERLKQLDSKNVIVHLHEFSNPTTREYLLNPLSEQMTNLLLQYGGTTHLQMSRSGKNLLRRFKYYLTSLQDKKLLTRVKHAITMYSESAKELRLLYSGPISSNTMGIDSAYWNEGDNKQSRHELGIPEGVPVILSASMLRPKKQIAELVRVFRNLREKGLNNFHLVIAGGGDKSYEALVKDLATPLLNEGKIRFTGRISDELLRKYYHASDLFLLLSAGEGSPVSIMKAHACGVPVVTTDYGEAPEICRKYNVGLVVPNTVEAWQNKLEQYLKGNLEIKKLGRENAVKHYEWKNVAAGFVEVYRKLLKEQRN